MRLIIAEKPSLARSIAAGIDGPRQSANGYVRVGDTTITHCFGHLYELAPPDAYRPAWKAWALETLPIAIEADEWLLLPRPSAEAQIRIIAGLLQQAASVVNAGDPDREGQMLVDELLESLRWNGPTQRLLLHDTTPVSVRKALASMKPNSEFKNLFVAAKCRSRADWLVGMNMTRAATKKIGITSHVGRVQTPTLALVVRRDLAIENHKASTFYTLAAHVASAADSVTLLHDTEHDRIIDKAIAASLAKALTGTCVTVAVTETPLTEHAPLPHKLATYQKVAESRHGWSATDALKALQTAYEAQIVSYPRTDCQYLPKEQAGLAVPCVTRILEAGHFPQVRAVAKHLAPAPRIYDDKKVEQHHGLTPTSKLPDRSTDPKAHQAWEIVTEQFIKSLLPSYTASVKEASFIHAGRTFKASGETPANTATSWRVLEPKKGRDGEPIKPMSLSLKDGEQATMRVSAVDVKQGKTTPPKPYTEASLIADMSAVHKFVDDPRIKAMLKETAGIGTAATQGATIEALKTRHYLALEGRGKKKFIRSTLFGRYVVQHLPAVLCDPGITALWEEQLNNIANGTVRPEDFMTRISSYVNNNIARVKATSFPHVPPQSRPAPTKPQARPRHHKS